VASPARAALGSRLHVDAAHPARVGIGRIFLAFLTIGATSFGGGVVAYLRSSLVDKHRWMDDETFLDLIAITQTLPGLKAVNLAILAGDRLHGAAGAAAAMIGICLPGALLMFAVGLAYQSERDRPIVDAALRGIAPAAVGLILATTLELGRKSLSGVADVVFVVATVLCVNRLNLPLPVVLVGIGGLAVAWYGSGDRRRGTGER
jgi:chromate transporter